ncbi:MAG: Uma2 family endonuclease [Armatimonadota bacterium]|nr:Uma2 family endonuclease [Armatimonadota bacterium]
MAVSQTAQGRVYYPDTDGQPMAENTVQYECIVTLKGNLELLFADDPNVFVAGDLLWYPVEGRPDIRQAPDVMVVFGRPKGHRGSYRQWEEGNIPPQVVFEVWSPSNRFSTMEEKMRFYERYGVEEYYIYYPESGEWDGWRREGAHFVPIEQMEGWVSPRLQVRFGKGAETELGLQLPSGRKMLSFMELAQLAERAQREAETARQRAEAERQRAERLAARLRELGIDPEQV